MSFKLKTGDLTGRVLLAVHAPKDPASVRLVPLHGTVLLTPVDPSFSDTDGTGSALIVAQPLVATIDAGGYITDGEDRSVTLSVGSGSMQWRMVFRAELAPGMTVNLETVIVTLTAEGLDVSRTVVASSTLLVWGTPAQSVVAEGGLIRATMPDGTVEEAPDPGTLGGEEEVTPTPDPDTVARRLVVLGDSHSDYTPPSSFGSWWWRIAADRAGLIEVGNFAHRGWDTKQGIQGDGDVPSPLAEAEKSPADLAFVMYGGNDLVHGITPDEYAENLKTMSTRLQAAGKRVVIVFPPPLFPPLNAQYGAQYQQMRALARRAAAETGAYYTDPWGVMAQADNSSDPAWDAGDTVHFNDTGHKVIADGVTADVQRFAGVTDPLGGDPRTLDWTRESNRSVTGDARVVVESLFKDDPLFRSDRVARLVGGPGQAVLYVNTGATPGERIRVEYPYRVTVANPVGTEAGLQDFRWHWPAGANDGGMGTPRTLVEGVRRYEYVAPPEATAGVTVGVGLEGVTAGTAEVLVGAARVSIVTPEGVPYRVVELPPPAYQGMATNGTGGPLTDAKKITWASGTTSSIYHRKAAHLTGAGPFPLVIHLHGDGFEEVTNYGNNVTTSVGYAYEKTAVEAGALFVMPRTPDTTNATWYDQATSTTWLVNFIKMLKAQYNVDEQRIFISGYSGGAEELSYNLVCDHHTLFQGGGAMMLGGGGADGLTGFTGIPSQKVKDDFLLRWWYGENDNGKAPSDTSIDAVTASAQGEKWYRDRGFNTARTMIPGKNHYTSETDGPAKLAALIAESNQKYGIK